MQTTAIRFECAAPDRYDRTQLVIRLLILIGLSLLGGSMGWLYLAIFLLLPAIAASTIDRTTAPPNAMAGAQVEHIVRWIVAFFAYMSLVTDTPPWDPNGSPVHFDVLAPAHDVTPKSALLRLLTSLPAGVVIALANLVGGLVGLWAAITILVDRSVSPAVHGFLHKVMTLNVRLLAYHGSLVTDYPLGTEVHTPAETPA